MDAIVRIVGGQCLSTTLRLWQRRRRDRAELTSLPEHMLNDIGLTRYDIEGGSRGRHGRV